MNYYWMTCPSCGCQVTINATDYPDRVSGSVRRWSKDRGINDGRKFEIARADVSPDGAFSTPCVCGAALDVAATPSARAEGRGGA